MRPASRTGQDGGASERTEKLLRLRCVDGSKRNGSVVEKLRVDPAKPHEDDRAEARVANAAGDELSALRHGCHSLDGVPFG